MSNLFPSNLPIKRGKSTGQAVIRTMANKNAQNFCNYQFFFYLIFSKKEHK